MLSPRRQILRAVPFLLPATLAWGQTPPLITTGGLPIGLEPVTTVGGQPVAVDHAPDSSGRLFVATRTDGQVRLLSDNTLQGTSFLSLATGGVALSSGGEKGLLGIAFHPNFNAAAGIPGRGKFYTYTSEARAATVDFAHPELGGVSGTGGDHDSVYREWTVNPSNPNVVDYAAGSRIVLRLRQPQGNHNGGAIRFGPDGYMYLTLGDGGGANDRGFGSTSSDPADGHSSTGNAQDRSNVYGKILRIDPLAPAATPLSSDPVSGNGKYRVPAANPFVAGTTNVDEIYAYGLRNPFQIGFDRVTGTLYAGDVGQSQREEIDIITSGGNYGWVNMEGTRVNTTALADIDPVGEYTHSDGVAVIGGTVYRGQNIPELYGKYIFGELDGAGTPQGRLFYMDAAGGAITEFTYAFNAPASTLHSIGEGTDGELYATFASGTVARLLGRQWLSTGGGSWNTAGNWLGGVPNSAGASANFVGRYASGDAQVNVTLDGNRTAGSLRFNTTDGGGGRAGSFRIAPGTGGTLTIDAPGESVIDVFHGAHEIAVPMSFVNSTNVTVAAGASIDFTGPISVVSPSSIFKLGPGTANMTGGVTLLGSANLHANAGTLLATNIQGGNLRVNGGLLKLIDGPTSKSNFLVVSAGGRLDVTDNALVIDAVTPGAWNGSRYTGIIGYVADGRSGGSWAGEGIITSEPHALAGITGIAVVTAGQIGVNTFRGANVLGGNVIIAYTYAGDANVDGVINIDDYGRIDGNVAQSGTVFGWYNGDFNYDGQINIDDYGIIDANIARQGAPLSSGSAAGAAGAAAGAVPDPAGAGAALFLAGAGAMARRRMPARQLR